ncbi:hypothetical protein KIPB_010175, partial [Kipferlia bialata]
NVPQIPIDVISTDPTYTTRFLRTDDMYDEEDQIYTLVPYPRGDYDKFSIDLSCEGVAGQDETMNLIKSGCTADTVDPDGKVVTTGMYNWSYSLQNTFDMGKDECYSIRVVTKDGAYRELDCDIIMAGIESSSHWWIWLVLLVIAGGVAYYLLVERKRRQKGAQLLG